MRLTLPRVVPPPSARFELCALVLVAWFVFASIPIALGGIGLGWDALNHHVYLGWIADRPRFDRDFLAASYQSFQYPYLYWPVYKLYESGLSGRWAGAVLVSFNVFAVPALWLLARVSVVEQTWYGVAMRGLAVALAFLTGVVLSLFDSTGNDLLAAIPLVWAIALAFEPWDGRCPAWLTVRRLVLLSGFCAGASVAFKLSNGPLAVLLPVLWGIHGSSLKQKFMNVAAGCVATVAGFLILYGNWGWQMWVHYGNPVYPFYDNWFAPVRAVLGFHP
jgi:hypothetical protein